MSDDGDQNRPRKPAGRAPAASRAQAAPAPGPETQKERVAKVMARAGLCSRREAEAWIGAGRVAVNGQTLTGPAVTVGPRDIVLVDGRPLPSREPPRVWRFNKPGGLVTTRKDEAGRPTVFDRLPPTLPRVLSVGRLDLNSEGLLLLTNDGELSRYLEMPSTGWVRRYRVRVHGRVDEKQLADLARGITIDGIRYQGVEAALDRQQGANAWLTIGLTEGKNREVRRIMEALGYTVSRLIRVSYGPFHLGNLREGDVEEIKANVLRDQLGAVLTTLARRTGDWTDDAHSGDRSARNRPGGGRPPRSLASRSAPGPGRDEPSESPGPAPARRKGRVKPQPPGGYPEGQPAQQRGRADRSGGPRRPRRS